MKWCHLDMLHHIWDKKSAAVTITVIFSSFTQVSAMQMRKMKDS